METEVIAGRYRLDTQLGSGGMAEVWLATDRELGRRVALKLLGPNADRARFDREARAAAALAHPNICQLYDYGETADGRPFMVLEYLSGGTLERRLVPGQALPNDEAARIANELAHGLAHAHARGLVHRDLKPANVLFDGEGRAKIADFGIARMGQSGTLTEAGPVLGTAAYISPEQAAGEPATPASDVYSLGVILYRMLAGRLPFESSDPIELVVMHRDSTPPPLSVFRQGVPRDLEEVTAAALAKDPRDRPPNGAALVTALAGTAAAPTVALATAGTHTQVLARPPRRGRRRRLIVLLAGATALA